MTFSLSARFGFVAGLLETSLPSLIVLGDIPRVNFLNLQVKQGLKNCVFRVYCGEYRQILEICLFKFELAYMNDGELNAYNMLRTRGCPLMPTISAYVFEKSEG